MHSENLEYGAGSAVVDEDLEHLPKVEAVVKAMSKYISGKKIYADNNPTLRKFAAEFHDSTTAFFVLEPELVISVQQHDLLWRGQSVYHNDRRDDSLAFLLYKDGLGEITLQQNATREELERLVDLLRDELHNLGDEEDIVTKFWRSDFESIYYRVLDEYLLGEFGEGRPQEGDEQPFDSEDHPDLPSFKDKGRVIVQSSDPLESLDEYIRDLAVARSEGDDATREEQTQLLLEVFFTVSSEELKLCQEEILKERKSDGLVDFLATILDFLLVQDNPSAVRDVSNVVECIVAHVAEECVPVTLHDTLQNLRSFTTANDLSDTARDFIEKMESQLTETSVLLRVGSRLDKWSSDADIVFNYYKLVGRSAIPAVSTLLGRLKGSRQHGLACDALTSIAGDDLEQIVEKFNMDDPSIARDAVQLISSFKSEGVPGVIRQLAVYPDDRVRADVVTYLAENRSADAIVLLLELLDDGNKHTRMKVLSAIEDMKDPMVSNKISALIDDKELQTRQVDEQELLFRAYGKALGEEALDQIESLVSKKGFLGFGKQQAKTGKLLALRALEHIPGARAQEMLLGLIEDGEDLIKTKALRILNAKTSESVVEKETNKDE